MIGREGALVLLLGAFSLSKWTAQGKRHEFIRHFRTTKSGGDFFSSFFFLLVKKNPRWKISPSSVLAQWLSSTSVITHHVCPLRAGRGSPELSLASRCLAPLRSRFGVAGAEAGGCRDGHQHTAPLQGTQQLGGQPWLGQAAPAAHICTRGSASGAAQTQAQPRNITANSSLQPTNFIFFP